MFIYDVIQYTIMASEVQKANNYRVVVNSYSLLYCSDSLGSIFSRLYVSKYSLVSIVSNLYCRNYGLVTIGFNLYNTICSLGNIVVNSYFKGVFVIKAFFTTIGLIVNYEKSYINTFEKFIYVSALLVVRVDKNSKVIRKMKINNKKISQMSYEEIKEKLAYYREVKKVQLKNNYDVFQTNLTIRELKKELNKSLIRMMEL